MGVALKFLISAFVLAAFSSSTHYKLQSYGVNAGGTNSAAGNTYSLQGNTGEVSGQNTSGSTYTTKNGSEQTQQASVPPAPAVDNGSGAYYNKLHVVVNNSANPSDATFAIEISSSSNCSSPSYLQADGTSNSSIVWQSYSSWGGSGGTYAVGLANNTTYYFCVAAQEGKFTASAFGPSAGAATATPSLTFSVSPNSITMNNLIAGSIITSPAITFSYTTNAYNGGFIYAAGSKTGLFSTADNYTIKVTGQQSLGSSEGAGLQATGTASLTAQSPYNGTSDTVGGITTTFSPLYTATGPVTTGSPTAVVKAQATATTPAATDYTVTLTFVAAANY